MAQGACKKNKIELITVTSVMTQTNADRSTQRSNRWHAYTGKTSYAQYCVGVKLPPVGNNLDFENAIIQRLGPKHISQSVGIIYPDPCHYYYWSVLDNMQKPGDGRGEDPRQWLSFRLCRTCLQDHPH